MNRNRLYVTLILLAVGGYWYFSPYITVRQLQAAAQAGDAAAFNQHVDYPRLRDSVKHQLTGMAAEPADDSLVGKLGQLVVDKVVNALVRPEAVMLAMQKGVFRPRQKHAGGDGDGATASKPHWSASREGLNTFVMHVSEDGNNAGKGVDLVLHRAGFADWKLGAIRLPADLRKPE